MLVESIQLDAVLQVFPGAGELTEPVQRVAEDIVGNQPQCRVVGGLGQPEQLFSELQCGLQIPAQLVKFPEPSEHGEEV